MKGFIVLLSLLLSFSAAASCPQLSDFFQIRQVHCPLELPQGPTLVKINFPKLEEAECREEGKVLKWSLSSPKTIDYIDSRSNKMTNQVEFMEVSFAKATQFAGFGLKRKNKTIFGLDITGLHFDLENKRTYLFSQVFGNGRSSSLPCQQLKIIR